MSVLQTRSIAYSGEYNFANDPNAGAAGTIRLGVYIPLKYLITGFWVIPIVNPASGGAATISFGHVLEDGLTNVTNSLMVATPFNGFVVRTPVTGIDLYMNPLSLLNDTVQVTMTIAGAALTAGRLAFIVQANQSLV